MNKEEIEKAKDNLLRGNDIEAACLIMQEVIWGNLVQVGGRVNVVKVAMRQILNFIEEYKNKGYLDVVKEKVQLKEKNNKLEQENKKLKHTNKSYKGIIRKLNKMIDEMAKEINAKVLTKEQWCPLLSKEKGCYEDATCLKCLKQYFERKVENKDVKD